MKALAAVALALLAGCASERVIDLRPAQIGCLQEGKLLGAVKIDAQGAITAKACLAVRIGRES